MQKLCIQQTNKDVDMRLATQQCCTIISLTQAPPALLNFGLLVAPGRSWSLLVAPGRSWSLLVAM